MDLDDSATYRRLDTADMLGHIRALPDQCASGWALAQSALLPDAYRRIRHVVVIGIGGSAIGATAVQALLSGECPLPITVVRDYDLPAYVDGREYLVVGCSYSGDTEETLSATREALRRDVHLMAITTGGRLAELARREAFPLVQYEYRSQPRAALGYPLTLLLGVFANLGLARDHALDLEEGIRVMRGWQPQIDTRVPAAHNEAKALAQRLSGRLPVIYGAGHLAAVASRWKTQLNENAKYWSYFEPMPELQHNSVVGFDSKQPVGRQTTVVMLRSDLDHPRIGVRWDVTAQMLSRAAVAVEQVEARGESRLAQMLSLIHLGDYVSYYVALLNDTDPTPVDAIGYLKRRLSDENRLSALPRAGV